jgi:hypothetical protein
MILQTVAGVKRGEFRHVAVAGDLGDDRGGGDGGAERVAVDDGPFLARKPGFLAAVDEAEIGLDRKARNGAAHGQERGLENIMRVDFPDRGDADGPVDFGVTAQKVIQFDSMFRPQLLRVVEMGMPQAVGQDRGGGEDRPGPAPAPHFIDTGDDDPLAHAQTAFE